MWDYFNELSAGEFWTDFGDIALRAFLSIVVLFILTKLMGNKQISQLNFFDYIIGISIGSIAAEMATNTDTPHHFFVLAMVIYTVITILITFVTRKSISMRRFFNGTPIPLIENGKIIEKNLAKAGFDVNDLLTELRYAGYFNIEDVQYAVEETDGRVSIIPRPSARPRNLRGFENRGRQAHPASIGRHHRRQDIAKQSQIRRKKQGMAVG